jgi:hypothetical protein
MESRSVFILLPIRNRNGVAGFEHRGSPGNSSEGGGQSFSRHPLFRDLEVAHADGSIGRVLLKLSRMKRFGQGRFFKCYVETFVENHLLESARTI